MNKPLMKRISIIGISSIALTVMAIPAITLKDGFDSGVFATGGSNDYWNHYAQVDPTQDTHGSKEFWASCSTHDFSLVAPGGGQTVKEGVPFNTTIYFNQLTPGDPRYIHALGEEKYTITFNSRGGSSVASITDYAGTVVQEPTKPTLSGYKFVGWSYDVDGHNQVSWPLTISSSVELYANWNEKVDIKSYFTMLLTALDQDPYSYIPNSMRPEYATKVESTDVEYDFNNFTNVSSIKYGGYGEQWHMVVENIEESKKFSNVLSIGEAIISSSVVIFNNFLDNNTEDTASHSISETEYTASIFFDGTVLTYSIQYKTGLTIPFFGTVLPIVEMSYNVSTNIKTVRIGLTENNAMKYVIEENHYTFALEYGVEQVSRKAYFDITKDEDEETSEGHIYEFVQLKDKDLVPSCADFYIGEEYTSVVGNKASGLPGFDGYINELYETDNAKLIGYKVRETFTKWTITKTYNTLWFNLNNILNINSVKAVSNGGVDPHENNHDIYLNGSSEIFAPKKNSVLMVKTSRRYDVEMRKQFFYGLNGEEIEEYETLIPMMFIQDDGTESGETNYSTFESDILTTNGIAASVTLANKYLTKIREDYLSLIDVFIQNSDDITGEMIEEYIG